MADLNLLTLGGAFSGIGGFELAWTHLGGRVAWTCEVEPKERQFLTERFSAPCVSDIQMLDPERIEPVDVFVGGSPCQGFSIAGNRDGLEHNESRLFADYIRVMEGLAQHGLKYAIWENVPGVLSITNEDDERTFEHVVAALVGSTRPVHLDRGQSWYSGLAVGPDGRRAVAWRRLDSRHFGVPQRRRRMFACVAFGRSAPERALEVLLVREGSSRNLEACAQAGQGVAGTLGGGSGRRGWSSDTDRMTFVPDVANPLTRRMHKGINSTVDEGQTPVVQAFDARQSDTIEYGDQTGPLDTNGHSIAVVMRGREGKPGGGKGPLLAQEQSLTLATSNDQVVFQPQAVSESQGGHTRLTSTTQALAGPGGKPGQGYAAALTELGVRRLTPMECERIQGFPDRWTEALGSDAARYRALGNAVTVNVVRWILGRAMATLTGAGGNW